MLFLRMIRLQYNIQKGTGKLTSTPYKSAIILSFLFSETRK